MDKNQKSAVLKRLLLILLALIFCTAVLCGAASADENSSWSEWAQKKGVSGDGSEENPYVITTVDQLKSFRDFVNDEHTGKSLYFALGADLNLKNAGDWTPIGKHNNIFRHDRKFSGTFDGRGHTISYLTHAEFSWADDYVGFFGRLTDGAVVKNIIFEKPVLIGENRVGIVAAYAEGNSSIENCIVNGGTITGDPDFSYQKSEIYHYHGGIVGYAKDCTITNCTIKGLMIANPECASKLDEILEITQKILDIITMFDGNPADMLTGLLDLFSFTSWATASVESYGGIVGLVDSDCTVSISDCTITAVIINGEKYAGGIVGHARGSSTLRISDCKVTSLVLTGKTYTGGILGRSEGTLHISNTEITSSHITSAGKYTGGIAAATASDSNIENCSFNGTIESRNDYVGGIVGENRGIVRSCTATGSSYSTGSSCDDVGGIVGKNIKGTIDTCKTTDFDVTGYGKYIGGCVGKNEGGRITNCKCHGSVHNDGSGGTGGFVGYTENGVISNCTAELRGNMTHNNSSVSGINETGGFVGHSINTSIENCSTTCVNEIFGITYVGGFVGKMEKGSISDSHYYYSGSRYYILAIVIGWNDDTGGFAGKLTGEGTISNCTTAIESVQGHGKNVGGFIGKVDDGGSITDCHTGAEVNAKSEHAGGFVGEMYNSKTVIKNCYATGKVYTTDGTRIGGFGGNIEGGAISECYATGSVSGPGDYVGGFVGFTDNARIAECFALGHAEGGGDGVGGFAGKINGGTVTNVYAAGGVKAGKNDAGGLVGKMDSGTLAYSIALNNSVEAKSGDTTGRVCGKKSGGTLLENYAWEEMPLPNGHHGAPMDDPDRSNGKSVSAWDIWDNASFYTETLSWNIPGTWVINDYADSSLHRYNRLPVFSTTLKIDESYLMPKFKIMYNGNGALTATSILDVTERYPNEIAASFAANTFKKAGWEFMNWNTAKDGSGVKYYANQTFTPCVEFGDVAEHELTLYAQWATSAYTVHFNKNGGSSDRPEPLEQSIDRNKYEKLLPNTYHAPDIFTQHFLGWTTNADGSGEFYFDQEVVYNLTDGTDITLYANWGSAQENYKITYCDPKTDDPCDIYSHIGHSYPRYFNVTSTAVLPTAAKAGYKFEGWYLDENFSDGPITSLSYPEFDKNTTVYAKWTLLAPVVKKDYLLPIPDGYELSTDTKSTTGTKLYHNATGTVMLDYNNGMEKFMPSHETIDYHSMTDTAVRYDAENETFYMKYNGTKHVLNAVSLSPADNISISWDSHGNGKLLEFMSAADSGTYTATITDGHGHDANTTIHLLVSKQVVLVPAGESKLWTGEVLKADITDTDTYTVSGNIGWTDVGTYPITLTLRDAVNYKWSTTEEAAVTVNFVIYKEKQVVEVPADESKEWTGEVLKADLSDTDEYTVLDNDGWTDAGTYPITLELRDPDGYMWATTDNPQVEVNFTITPRTTPVSDSGAAKTPDFQMKVTLSKGAVDSYSWDMTKDTENWPTYANPSEPLSLSVTTIDANNADAKLTLRVSKMQAENVGWGENDFRMYQVKNGVMTALPTVFTGEANGYYTYAAYYTPEGFTSIDTFSFVPETGGASDSLPETAATAKPAQTAASVQVLAPAVTETENAAESPEASVPAVLAPAAAEPAVSGPVKETDAATPAAAEANTKSPAPVIALAGGLAAAYFLRRK